VKNVVLCGVLTHLCVETTARHAFMLNFQPIIVSNACASESKEHHDAALLNLAHGFAYICETKTITHALSPCGRGSG
jgi:isochorismate hydrolase